jgi:sugar lactone lactonase YvrE
MSVLLSRLAASKWKMFCSPVLALAFGAVSVWAQAPAIVIDAQQTIGFGYSNPQSIAVSKNGTVFIADTNNNQIIALDVFAPAPGVNTPVTTGIYALTSPKALALDANGNLFVGDSPTAGGRIIKLAGDGNGNLTGAAALVFSGTPLVNPISLAVDSSGTLFIGDYPPSQKGAIYSLPAGGTKLTTLNFTGLPAQFTPAALLRDSSNNLYFADNGNFTGSNGGVYIASASGVPAAVTPINTGSFVINQPSGLARDAAGDLYILSLLGTGSGPNPGQQVVDVPAASPTTPYILPNTGIGTSSSMAFDPYGHLDVLDSVDGAAIQLATNTVDLGNVFLGQTGSKILFNFEFNASANLGGFRSVTQGDVSTEVAEGSGGNCVNRNHGTGITPYTPYTCFEFFSGKPAYPGIRSSAIQVKGAGAAILASMPVWQTGFAGAEVTYPLTASATAAGLQQPQAVAISGLNGTVYVADILAAQVYSTTGLAGTVKTAISTAPVTLIAPSALAIDGAGDLFIADFGNGAANSAKVIEVSTTTGVTPSAINTGGLLQHPIALALDYLGNMYIGDAGPGGVNASTGNPGYVVEIPVGGAPFKMTLPVAVVFPQALAIDPYTAALSIGDGGDPSGSGQVVQVLTNGTGSANPIAGVSNPTGLAFDAAENLYVLDGNVNTITVVPPPQSNLGQYPLSFDNSTLSAASALAVSAGAQSFVIANIGSPTTNDLVFLNGNASALQFGNVNLFNTSPPLTATEYNIGNLNLTLGSPYFSQGGGFLDFEFGVQGNSTCANAKLLSPSTSCTINVAFTPFIPFQANSTLTVNSDGYNGGGGSGTVPTLTLQGTGVFDGFAQREPTTRDSRNRSQRRSLRFRGL